MLFTMGMCIVYTFGRKKDSGAMYWQCKGKRDLLDCLLKSKMTLHHSNEQLQNMLRSSSHHMANGLGLVPAGEVDNA